VSSSILTKVKMRYAHDHRINDNFTPRTETKAVTVYPVKDLLAILPKSLHTAVRTSRYHTKSNDSLTFHAQVHRSRSANLEENGRKLMEEITRIYHANTPAETSDEKKKKHQDMYVTPYYRACAGALANMMHISAAKFHESRMRSKKAHSSKKQSRRGFID
jgi:peptidyl-tRNA hydrolase ICT1